MVISQIYEKYKIMPQLQLHQLRVTGVAKMVCDNFEKPLDQESILSACLLHDMGNVVKFNFNSEIFPESWFAPQGKAYWKKVKTDFIRKYGNNEHVVTYEICKSLGVSKEILNLIEAIGFSKAESIFKSNNFNLKIVAYSDQRVAPYGIASVEDRHAEGRKRYVENNNIKEDKYDLERFNFLSNLLKKVEKQIFTHCKIKPEDITEEKVKMLIEELKNFSIETK